MSVLRATPFPARGLPIAIFAAMLALVLTFAASDRAYASFDPTGAITVVDPAPGAHSDIVADFSIQSPDVNTDALITFIPTEFTITPGSEIPDGAIAGMRTSTVTVGFINGACNSSLQVNFTMLDATIDRFVTVSLLDPDVRGGHPGGDTDDDFDDQFDIGPDGLPLGVTRYPDYLTRLFDTLPISRTYGQTLASGIPLSMNVLLFAPGTVFENGDLLTDPRLGYPSVPVLQDGGDPEAIPQPAAITDFCSPLAITDTSYGITRDNPDTAADESGVVRTTNPTAAGTYAFATWAAGLRDFDGDGWENLLDVCWEQPNPEWDPRQRVIAGQPGDRDGDAMPDACDPSPDDTGFVGIMFDEDRDQYGNRQDNCPLVANSFGSGTAGEKGTDNQADRDSDQIGDACDPEPDTPNGARPTVCIISNVDIRAGGTPNVDPADLLPCNPNALVPTPPTPTPLPTATPAVTPVILPSTGDGSAPAAGSLLAMLAIGGGVTLAVAAGLFGFATRRRRT